MLNRHIIERLALKIDRVLTVHEDVVPDRDAHSTAAKRVVGKAPQLGVFKCVRSVDTGPIPRTVHKSPAHDLPEGRRAVLHAYVQGLADAVRVPAFPLTEVRVCVVALGRVGALANDVADIEILGHRVRALQADDLKPAP